MQRLAPIILLLVGFFCAAQAAEEVDDLYQHRVEVNSQAATERTNALREALQATLLKLSGDDEVLASPIVDNALRNVRDYVVQYGYQQETEALYLWAQFDPAQVERLILDAGGGIWSSLRPKLLVWLVQENEDLQRRMYAADSEAIVVQQLRNAAQRRGLPIQLPLLDLNDTMTVSVIDVWARFMDTIDFASQRYSPDGVIVARIYQTIPDPANLELVTDKWQVDWTLNLGELRWRGEATAMDPGELGAAVIADVTAQLAARYRISSESDVSQQWTVQIDDLPDLTTTIAAEQLLANIPAVNDVQLVAYGQHRAEFSLSLTTDPARIRQALDLSQELQAVAVEGEDPTESNLFRWIAEK